MSAAVLSALAGQAAAQVDRTWAEAVSGVFSDGSRWTPGGTPQQADNIFINVTGAAYGVTLDSLASVNNFELTSGDATFNLDTFGFGTGGNFTLQNGVTQGAAKGSGAVLVGGAATMTDAILQSMDTYASVGDTTVTNMFISDMNLFSVGPNGTATVANTVFQGVDEVVFEGDVVIDAGGGLNSCFDDTCVDSRGDTMLIGDGSLGIGDGGEFNNGGLFSTDGDQSNSIEGTGKTAGVFNNTGTFVKSAPAAPLPTRGGSPVTIVGSNIDFNNTGVVQVEGGELRFDTQILSEGTELDSGTWNVFNNQTLTFTGQNIEKITNGSKVNIQGANSAFQAIESLREVGAQSEFEIGSGRNFETFLVFTNQGTLTIGDKSTFDADESGFTNYLSGVLFDGTFDIAGTLLAPSNDQIQFLESNVILRGVNSVFQNIDPLEIVGSQGRFEVTEGRNYGTMDDFEVFDGGKLVVGDGSEVVVNGQLINFASGVFDEGFFEVAGTLRADGIAINVISNELILDGVESEFLDEQGNDALDALQCIAPDGILRLRNGRTLDNLSSLKVEGILEIDPAAGRATRDSDPQITTLGGISFEGDAQVILHIDGTAPGLFGSMATDGNIEFSDSALVASRLSIIIGDGYIPMVGDEFLLMDSASFDGRFAAFDVTGLDAGLDAELIYSATSLSLRITPTPGTTAVFALGGVMAMRRRR